MYNPILSVAVLATICWYVPKGMASLALWWRYRKVAPHREHEWE